MKKAKREKYVQLAITAAAGIAFFLVLLLAPDLRDRLFLDRSLLSLCAIMWAFMIITIIFILVDLERLIRWEAKGQDGG